jgi:hypothetical protein
VQGNIHNSGNLTNMCKVTYTTQATSPTCAR